MAKILTQKEFSKDMASYFSEAVQNAYQDLIREAVLKEREECAKLCEELDRTWTDANGIQCAEAIRGRE